MLLSNALKDKSNFFNSRRLRYGATIGQARFMNQLNKTEVIASPQGVATPQHFSKASVQHNSNLFEVAASLRSSQ